MRDPARARPAACRRGREAAAHLEGRGGGQLHAPVLLRYEVPIVLHHPKDTPAVVAMAQRLECRSAYDAAYVVLAEEPDTLPWTLDGRLARNAAACGLHVQVIQTG